MIIITIVVVIHYQKVYKPETIAESNLDNSGSLKISKNAEEDTVSVKNKRKLIILSAMFRSGSSFLGSLFDKNPNFSYYFEPTTLFSDSG